MWAVGSKIKSKFASATAGAEFLLPLWSATGREQCVKVTRPRCVYFTLEFWRKSGELRREQWTIEAKAGIRVSPVVAVIGTSDCGEVVDTERRSRVNHLVEAVVMLTLGTSGIRTVQMQLKLTCRQPLEGASRSVRRVFDNGAELARSEVAEGDVASSRCAGSSSDGVETVTGKEAGDKVPRSVLPLGCRSVEGSRDWSGVTERPTASGGSWHWRLEGSDRGSGGELLPTAAGAKSVAGGGVGKRLVSKKSDVT